MPVHPSPEAEVDDLLARVSKIAGDCGAVYNRASESEAERLAFWAGRKAAFPAVVSVARNKSLLPAAGSEG